MDTHLNWGSSYWTNDIYKRFVCTRVLKKEPTTRSLVWVARFSNLLILGIAFFIMLHLASIQTAWRISLMLGAGMGIVLVLRWIWWRMNAWGELSCIAASLILAPMLLWWFPGGNSSQEAMRLLWIAFGSTGVGVCVALLTPAEDLDQLKMFYRRAQPPGFWGPIASAVGEESHIAQERLGYGVGATFAASFSVFGLLVSIGSWLLDAPAPVWFPWKAVWRLGLLVLSVAVIPLWWKWSKAPEVPPSKPSEQIDIPQVEEASLQEHQEVAEGQQPVLASPVLTRVEGDASRGSTVLVQQES
ncbi:MAG: hypothetical protein AAGJ35_13175 [Myxococcota bacterium]